MPEPEDDDIVIQGRVPLSGRGYEFTIPELRVMHRRLHLSLRAVACEHYQDDFEQQGFNSRHIWKMLLAVHKGCLNTRVPLRVMTEVYAAARVTYRSAVEHLKRDEAQARRQALVAAQIPLEKFLDITPETDYTEAVEENEYGIVTGRWIGRREGNA